MSGRVTWHVDASVGWVTISNPEHRNALTAAMLTQLADAFIALGNDAAVAAVVLRGDDGQFCSGADLSDTDALNPRDERALLAAAHAAISATRQPTIAFIEGNCLGAGVATALCCDLRIATGDARFGIPAARIGLLYPPDGLTRLVRQVGVSAAKMMLLSVQTFDADWAAACGLINRVLRGDDSSEQIAHFTARIAGGSRLALTAAKELIGLLGEGRDEEADHRFREWAEINDAVGESAEGIAAFAEKRAPDFPWRLPSSS